MKVGRPDPAAAVVDRAAAAAGVAGAGRGGGGRRGRGGPHPGGVHRPGPAAARGVRRPTGTAPRQVLVRHARTQDAVFVASVGRKLAEVHNPDGFFDDRDRANRRGLVLGAAGRRTGCRNCRGF